MANPTPTPTPKKVPVKGKPMGIPMWGWVIAAVIGIVIGYTILKKSGGAVGSSSVSEGSPDALGNQTEEGKSEAGSIALPLEDILSALGLRGSSATPPTAQTPLDQGSSASQSAQESALQESISDPFISDNNMTPSSWDTYVAGGQTNEQLPTNLQLEGVPSDYPVISSFFDTPQTIQGPGFVDYGGDRIYALQMPGSTPVPSAPLITDYADSRPVTNVPTTTTAYA